MAYDYLLIPEGGAFRDDELAEMERWWRETRLAAPHFCLPDFLYVFADAAERARRAKDVDADRLSVEATTASVWLRPSEVSLALVLQDATDLALHAFAVWCLERFRCRLEYAGSAGGVDPSAMLPGDG